MKVANNVAEVLLTPDQPKEAGEHQIVQALENKYDTLKDKILAEALIAQVWVCMCVCMFVENKYDTLKDKVLAEPLIALLWI